jgi:hypothetical protein
MKTLKTMILSVGAVALLGASGLSAQTRASADIPFEFTVQNTTLPAGTYTMSVASLTRNVMSIQNEQTGRKVLVLGPDAAAYRRPGDKNVVVFHKSGDRYFLAAVKTDAVCTNVPPSKLERELASAGNGRVTAVIVAAVTVR